MIKDRTYDTISSRVCFVINEYLGVVPLDEGYKIYNIKQGKPFIRTLFASKDDAIKSAKIFAKSYEEYLPMLDTEDWKNANIPSLCQYSITNGINLYKFVQYTEQVGKPVMYAYLLDYLEDR